VVKALATGDGLPALWKEFESGEHWGGMAAGRLVELESGLKGTQEGFELSAGAADLQSGALYDLVTAAGVATGEVDDLGNAIVEMPDGKTFVVDAETQTAYEDLDAIEAKKLSEKNVAVKLVVDDSAVQGWHAPLLHGTVSMTPKNSPALDNLLRRWE
jgi:hypothetical protein